MLVFDREGQESIRDGAWRDYEGGVRTKIRPFGPEMARQIRKSAQKSGRFDQEMYDLALFDYLIADWNVPEAIKKDGKVVGTKPMPCTAENKLMVVRAWQAYRHWVATTADALGEESAQISEAELGNLGGSSDGRRTGPGTETSSSAAQVAG
ncbi:MAG: hypothetical protein ACOY3Z_00875 [Thermodesulfobacteriota bacterium]